MNPTRPGQLQFEKVIRFGSYHYPAALRYPSGSIVICDRCDQRGLKACLGYQNFDLCLKCAGIVSDGMQHGPGIPWERPGDSMTVGPPTHVRRIDPRFIRRDPSINDIKLESDAHF